MTQLSLKTKIEELSIPQRLVNRLKMCQIKTFQEVMEVNPRDWTDVNSKVLNSLKRFQASHREAFAKLKGGAESVLQEPEGRRRHAAAKIDSDRRFFVANNLLNAYAATGQLFGVQQPSIDEAVRQIMAAADAFMDAFNMPAAGVEPEAAICDEPCADDIAMPEELDDDIDQGGDIADETAEQEADEPESLCPIASPGQSIRLIRYKGAGKCASKRFGVGSVLAVRAMDIEEGSGVTHAKVIIDGKNAGLNSKLWDWEIAE